MNFQLKTLLISTALLCFCVGVFASHQKSINQVHALEKKVEPIVEDTILDMKAQWRAEFEEQVRSDAAYQGEKIPEEVIHVYRGKEATSYCVFEAPARYRKIGGLFRGSTSLRRRWGMSMNHPDTALAKSDFDERESEMHQVYLWIEHSVPWRLLAAPPETIIHGSNSPRNERFLEILRTRLDQAGVRFQLAE